MYYGKRYVAGIVYQTVFIPIYPLNGMIFHRFTLEHIPTSNH